MHDEPFTVREFGVAGCQRDGRQTCPGRVRVKHFRLVRVDDYGAVVPVAVLHAAAVYQHDVGAFGDVTEVVERCSVGGAMPGNSDVAGLPRIWC